MRSFVLVFATAGLLAGCGSTVSLQSHRPSEPVSVDAQLTEWGGRLDEIERDKLSMGVQNDDDYLYVSLSTRDPRTIGQIMQAGMILWIDRSGGRAQTFGIRFPLGLSGNLEADRDLGEGLAANRIRIERSVQELEIVGEGGQTVRRRKDAVPGLSVAVEAEQRVLTYELQIPLALGEGILYAVGAEPGQQIGIGITTPDLFESDGELAGTGGLPGGSLSSADGRGYSGPRPGTGFLPGPIKHWTVVTLAGGA